MIFAKSDQGKQESLRSEKAEAGDSPSLSPGRFAERGLRRRNSDTDSVEEKSGKGKNGKTNQGRWEM
ncbi:MAG: hypothetical protein EBS69_09565 [Verrucomicrobia bacterium]|nr:hypothetical protein [Verrucomicrobiota bacterium]NBS07606.1 hypothetical protein [Verrucomicrobiota bacterium]NBT24854.1 hypothetical protein [bacterium]